jgi:hypothetical protein
MEKTKIYRIVALALCALIFLSALIGVSSAAEEGMEKEEGIKPYTYMGVVGAIIGIVLTAYMLIAFRGIGGLVKRGLNLMVGGIVIFTLSFIFTAIVHLSKALSMNTSMGIHMSLMVLAMLVMAIGAIKLGGLTK